MKTFKQKLMVFVSLICVILIGSLLLFSGFLLEPAYLAMTKHDLTKELELIEESIETHGLFNETGTDFCEEIKKNVSPLVTDGQCLEISDLATGRYIGGADHISGCALHTEHHSNSWVEWSERRSINNMMTLSLRAATAEKGTLATEVSNYNDDKQYVVGSSMPDQGVVLLLSASLERVGQAADVLQKQLTWLGLALLVVALAMAWGFASWFTRPIAALSTAARRMAKGDYNVQVPVTQDDEIGALTRDFNTMAHEVQQTSSLQQELIANVSHDLRTPLTLIKGYAETIRDLNGDDKAKRDAQLNIIISESDRLSSLVGSVLELSRLDAGTEAFAPVTFDISDFCEEMSYRYEDLFRKNGYTLQLETPGERLIHADPELISRVLHNLISNAINHIGEDGIVRLRVWDEKPGSVSVAVEDHGSGIPKDELPHLFKRYYRARQAGGRQGNGLGLSIVRAILVTHHFPFGVHSTPGHGSSFWFSAPVAAPGKPSTPAS